MKKSYRMYVHAPILVAVFLLLFTLTPFIADARGAKILQLPQLTQFTEIINRRICNHFGRLAPRRIPIPLPPFCVVEPEPPAVNLSAEHSLVLQGATTTLSWNSSHVTLCDAGVGWSGIKPLSGSEIVTVNATTTYSLSCGNGTATSTDSVIVDVLPLIPPTLFLSAFPELISEGATSTLSWSSTHTTLCTAGDGWSGVKLLSGSEIVSPVATTTYALTCGGEGGTIEASTTVAVKESTESMIGHVVISEVYYDVDGSHGDEPGNEWIELYNGTDSLIELSGWAIGDSVSPQGDVLPPGTTISPGGFLFITASSTTASFWTILGEIVVLPNSIGSNGLGNTGDAVFLTDTASTTVDSMSYGTVLSPFNPSVATTTSGFSIARKNLTQDSDTASDWESKDIPTPGSF